MNKKEKLEKARAKFSIYRKANLEKELARQKVWRDDNLVYARKSNKQYRRRMKILHILEN